MSPGSFRRFQAPSAAKASVDFAALTARLKPRPFKTKIENKIETRISRKLLGRALCYQRVVLVLRLAW